MSERFRQMRKTKARSDRSVELGSAGPAADHRAAVGQLFRDHNRALVNFLLTRLRSEQEARDVAQEAYVRLLQLDQPGAVSFLRGYLFRIAANLSVDRLRQRDVRERGNADLFDFDEFDGAAGTEHRAITGQALDAACDALNELSVKCRKAFFLRVVEGYRTPEVAKAMGVTERTVRKYVTSALLHCRHRLNEREAGEGK